MYGEHAQTCSDCGQALTTGGEQEAATLPVALGLSFQQRTRPLNTKAWALSIALPAALLLLGFVSFLPTVYGASHLSLFNFPYALRTSVLAVNVTPFLLALVLVEAAAKIVPGWRRLRESEGGRRRMLLAGLGLGGVLAVAHAGIMAFALGSSRHGNDADAMAAFIGAIVVAVASVAVGLMVSRRYRLNGFAVFSLLLSAVHLLDLVFNMADAIEHGTMAPLQAIIAAGTCGMVALLATRLFDDRPLLTGRRGVPEVAATWSHYPVVALASISLGLLLLSPMWSLASLFLPVDAMVLRFFVGMPWVRLVVIGFAFVFLARAFWPTARITRAAAVLTGMPTSDVEREVGVGVKDRLVKEGALVAVVLLFAFIYGQSDGQPTLTTYLFVVAAVAFAKDLRQEVSVERTFGDVVYVAQLTRVWEASVLQEAWARQGRQGPLHVRGVHYRSLFQFFAPEVFLDVFAKEEDVDAVREQIERLRAASANA